MNWTACTASILFYIIISFTISIISANDSGTKCDFPTHTKDYKGFAHLKVMDGQSFEAKDPTGEYMYYLRICDSPVLNGSLSTSVPAGSGLVQVDQETKRVVDIGKFTSAEVTLGTGWLLLQYENGEKYNEACGKTPRRASIMVMCPADRTAKPTFRVLEENTDRTGDNCYYLFELEHSAVCAPLPSPPAQGMSAFTVIFLIVVSVAGVYLCVGMTYKRLAFGARGCSMVPNNLLWKRVGNAIADGCDWLCRCRGCDASDRPQFSNYQPMGQQHGDNHHVPPPAALVLAHDDLLTTPGFNHFDQQQSGIVSRLSDDEGDLYRDEQLLQV